MNVNFTDGEFLQRVYKWRFQSGQGMDNSNNQETSWNSGLSFACYGVSPEHCEIAELIISKGANEWHYPFINACKSGNRAVVEMMISKGVLVSSKGVFDWNLGLVNACGGSSSGHREIVKLTMSKGANDWTRGFLNACY